MHAISGLQLPNVESTSASHVAGQIHCQDAPIECPIVIGSKELGIETGSEKINGVFHQEVIGWIVWISQSTYQRGGIWRMACGHMIRINCLNCLIAHCEIFGQFVAVINSPIHKIGVRKNRCVTRRLYLAPVGKGSVPGFVQPIEGLIFLL